MSEFYTKTKGGKYIPITFKKIITKDWENRVIVVRIGSDEHPAPAEELTETLDSLDNIDALETLENTSFLVSLHSIDFEIIGSVKEMSEKCVAISVTGSDDLSKLGSIQRQAKEQLRGKTKKVVVLPSPITVEEYSKVKEVLKRLEVRRLRRSR